MNWKKELKIGVGNSLLVAAGFSMCGEFDLKNCVAMMIFARLGIETVVVNAPGSSGGALYL